MIFGGKFEFGKDLNHVYCAVSAKRAFAGTEIRQNQVA
jgi:hypothetical protein